MQIVVIPARVGKGRGLHFPAISFNALYVSMGIVGARHIMAPPSADLGIVFGEEEQGTLFLRLATDNDTEVVLLKWNKSGAFQVKNAGLSEYFRKKIGCDQPCARLMIGPQREDGWWPIITSSWKQLNQKRHGGK